jgi:UDP-glucose 4-epimerase
MPLLNDPMKLLVTGSAGHLGEALVRTLRQEGHTVVGLDVVASDTTSVVGSIVDERCVRDCMRGVTAVLHAATLHKPHVATHARQAFVDVNITGTLNLLEAAVAERVSAFVFTSTTSVFGDSLAPPRGAPAAWITEDVPLTPKNIYGVTKSAAEDLCLLFHRKFKLPAIVLRTSRFFPEPDDDEAKRRTFDDANLKVIELLYRRVDLHDVVTAHAAAVAHAGEVGFGRYIISATSPFEPADVPRLRGNAADVVRQRVPAFEAVFAERGWGMLADIDRVYVNARARGALGWVPQYDFARAVADLARNHDPRSPLAQQVQIRGYHRDRHTDGLYPVES